MTSDDDAFDRSVFVNCPFDDRYAPLLEAALFVIVSFGFRPRLANERLDGGENRLDKIVTLIESCRFSIHDLSRCIASAPGEAHRMNMPFEFGIDVGLRRGGEARYRSKKFLIFEKDRFDLKRALSDISGQDAAAHHDQYDVDMKEVREFFRVEAISDAAGTARLLSDYIVYQEWMFNKKLFEGHSEKDALKLPTRERLDEMGNWIAAGKPAVFETP